MPPSRELPLPSSPRYLRGDELPRIVAPPPGERSREISAGLERHLAPGISTVALGQPSVVWQEAVGANVLDVDGNIFVDLTSGFGVASIGHRRPEVVAAVADQADRLVHALGDVAAHPARLALARRLCELAPIFISLTASSSGNVLPSLRRPTTSLPIPMIFRIPVRR